jgi:hypothetical protein
MNRFTRILTMAGLGLVTGVTMAAGPAMASTSSDQGTSKSGTNAGDSYRHGDRVVGVFRSWRACDRAGEYGEDEGFWQDYECEPIRGGFRRGFALIVDYDNWGHGWGGHFPSHWGNSWRPYPGHFFPGGGFPGGGFPGGGFPGGGPRPPFGPPFGGGGVGPFPHIPTGAPFPSIPGTGTPPPPPPVR